MNKGRNQDAEQSRVAEVLENAEAEYLFNRVSALTELPDNPYGAAVFDGPRHKSFLVAKNKSPMNNRICGLDIESSTLPADDIERFVQAGAPVHLPVIGTPKDVREKAAALDAVPLRGWTHGQFYADLKDLPESDAADHARPLEIGELDAFVKIHSAAFRQSGTATNMAVHMFHKLLAEGLAEAYAVDVDAAPVAIGLVYFASNQTAYLATAATTRAARKKGAHSALIARRIEAARQRGCVRISSTALRTSQSSRNLKRSGLSLSHVQTLLVLS